MSHIAYEDPRECIAKNKNVTLIKIDSKYEVIKESQEKMQEDLEKSKMRMDEIEDVLDGHNNLLEIWKCPTSKPNYRSIENRCYYFETTFKSYEDAKQNCNTKFPQGKLFEPKSLSSNKYPEVFVKLFLTVKRPPLS